MKQYQLSIKIEVPEYVTEEQIDLAIADTLAEDLDGQVLDSAPIIDITNE